MNGGMDDRPEGADRRCATCGRPASQACLRCGAPLCPTHRHPAARRCEACEAAFDAEVDARLTRPIRRADRLVDLMFDLYNDRGRLSLLVQLAALVELVGLWAWAKAVRLWARRAGARAAFLAERTP